VGHTKIERAVRWIFIVSAVATIASLIGLSLIYGKNLEYRFEVVVLSINWSVLIVTGLLLSFLFRRVWAKTPL
jgi:formate hydrogenlyase subunit 3/multisubunit Na+/H+ antiporter MnhD subunit